MKKLYGMKMKDWEILGRMLSTTASGKNYKTVAEYIAENPTSVTNRRTSNKGNEIIEVTYPTGKVKEYPISHINTTTAFEY